jgi:hypothetical protein
MKKRILTILTAALLLGCAWIINAFTGNPVSTFLVRRNAQQYTSEEYAQTDKELPLDVSLQAEFREDGTAALSCGDETLTVSMGSFPAESRSLGGAQVEVLSPKSFRVVFGDTAILFLQGGTEIPDVTADVVWGHVTRSYGATFAVIPEAPGEKLRQTLEAEGMTLLSTAVEGNVSAQSDGIEFLLTWSSQASFPAISAAN